MSPTSGVIDLTNDASDKDEDLKKAIALSLKEHEKVLGGQVSMEDQDISRCVVFGSEMHTTFGPTDLMSMYSSYTLWQHQ